VVRAPTASLVAPDDGIEIRKLATAALVAQVTGASSDGPAFVKFEVAKNPEFSGSTVLRYTSTVGADGRATLLYVVTESALDVVGSYVYWRALPVSGELVGTYSAVRSFRIAAEAQRPPLFMDPPTLLSPTNGGTSSLFTMFSVRVGKHSDGAAAAWIYVSPVPEVNSGVQKCLGTAVLSTGIAACGMSLKAGRYYWRAQGATGTTSLANGILSDYSTEIRSVVVIPEKITWPTGLTPSSGQLVHVPSALTVNNSTQTGGVGPFVYHFEVATGVDEAPFVSGTVPEGIGKTSWILPASLPIGLMLHWRVWAEDGATGVISDAGGAQFMVAQRASGLYALEVRGPSGCQGPFVISGAVAGTTTDQVFRVTTSGTLTLDLTTAGADLAGSIGGSAQSYSFSGSDPSGGAPALATRNGDGTISGSLDGKLSYYPNGIGRSCTGTFTWTLQPI